MNRRTKWVLGFALLVGVGLVAMSGTVLYPRYVVARRLREARLAHLKRRAIRLYMQENLRRRLTADELAEFPDDAGIMTELVDRMVDDWESASDTNFAKPWRRAFQLWALEPEPRDPRPLGRLMEKSRDQHLRDETRLELLYLIEELNQPTFAAALHLPEEPWLAGTNAEVLAALRELAPIDLDPGLEFPSEGSIDARPPGALAEIVQALGGEVVREGSRFKIRRIDLSNEMDFSITFPADSDDDFLRLYGIERAWWPVQDCLGIDLPAQHARWRLLGRAGVTLHLMPDGREPLRFFRAVCALRGLTPPRKIAERVYETAPVSSETRR